MKKIQHTDGCICDSLTINDVESIDIPVEQLKGIIKKALDTVEDLSVLQQLLISIVDSVGEYEDLGQCSQCGDDIIEYTLDCLKARAIRLHHFTQHEHDSI